MESNEIKNPSLQRLVLKAGIRECSSDCYENIRRILERTTEKIAAAAVPFMTYDKVVRLQPKHVFKALEHLNMASYARNCGQVKRKGDMNTVPRVIKNCIRKDPKSCNSKVHLRGDAERTLDKIDSGKYVPPAGGIKVPRRWHKGTSALRAIRKLQKQQECNVIAKATFARYFREVLIENSNQRYQATPESVDIIQTSVEAYILKVLLNSANIIINRKAIRLKRNDIELAASML